LIVGFWSPYSSNTRIYPVLTRLFRLFALLVCACCWLSPAQGADIVIVSSDRSTGYADALQALTVELQAAGHPVAEIAQLSVLELSNMATVDALALTKTKLFVAFGSEALASVLGRDLPVPVLAALIPRLGFERVLRDTARKPVAPVTALYLDQPFGRQLDLVRLIFPDAKRIGVVWGPESVQQQPLLLDALRSRDMQEVSAKVSHSADLFAGLKAALDDVSILIAIADPQVFSSGTIANILLSTYRARIPLLGFSPAYARAGAMVSLHSTPAQIGRQAGGLATSLLRRGGIRVPSQYPTDFTVDVNQQVARSLGVVIDAATLATQLRRLEARQ
jgi:putative tryptophan/tyrosine transport system substrate-binding protein